MNARQLVVAILGAVALSGSCVAAEHERAHAEYTLARSEANCLTVPGTIRIRQAQLVSKDGPTKGGDSAPQGFTYVCLARRARI